MRAYDFGAIFGVDGCVTVLLIYDEECFKNAAKPLSVTCVTHGIAVINAASVDDIQGETHMQIIFAIAAAFMFYTAAPTVASAQGWNQKSYNNSQAAKTSQQHYNRQTNRR